jgi:hypothetical protein
LLFAVTRAGSTPYSGNAWFLFVCGKAEWHTGKGCGGHGEKNRIGFGRHVFILSSLSGLPSMNV